MNVESGGGSACPFPREPGGTEQKSCAQDASNLLSPSYPMSAISESYIQTAANNHPPQHHSTPVRQYSRGSTQQPSIIAGSGTRSRVQNSRPAPQQIDRFADVARGEYRIGLAQQLIRLKHSSKPPNLHSPAQIRR